MRDDVDTVTDHVDTKTPEPTATSVEDESDALNGTAEADETDESGDASSENPEVDEDARHAEPPKASRRVDGPRLLAYAVLPALALLLAMAAGYLKWQDSWARSSATGRIESVAAAKDATIALLSYKPDTAEKDLGAARDRLTGTFKDSYTQLIHDVVIPGAKQKHISSVATVPATASVSATPSKAVALLFVNQTIVVGGDAPSDTASTVRVTLDKVDGRWLISQFDPI